MFLVYQIKMLYYAGRIAGIVSLATGGYVYRQHHENRTLASLLIKQQEENDILVKLLHEETERTKTKDAYAKKKVHYINVGLAFGAFIGATYLLFKR